MMRRLVLAIALLSVVVASSPLRASTASPQRSSPHDAIAEAVNRYRASKGLSRLPLSASLTRVAQAHLADLEANYRPGARCNMHSWSDRGDWSPCCYTPDHAEATCMWDKPKEISGGLYGAPGYEIVAYYSSRITPETALELWEQSQGHRAMVLNRGIWADNTWRAMGAAIGRHYAVVWFGESPDPAVR